MNTNILIRHCLLLMLVQPSSLKAEDSAREVSLESITVKGTKGDRAYAETPDSVRILRDREVSQQGRDEGLQVIQSVANVTINKNGESFSIRGINNTGVTGYQKDNLASIIIDDVVQTDLAIQAGSFDLWDLQRIEILRGVQSTTQGVNSLAGTILLDHLRPEFASEGAAKLGAGSFDHRELGLVTNHEVISQKLALRLAVGKDQSGGYIKNIKTNNPRWGRYDKNRIRLGLNYKITDQDALLLDMKYHQNDQGGTYTQGRDPFKYEVNEDQDYLVQTRNYQGRLRYDKNLNASLTNTAIISTSKSLQDANSDADGTHENIAGERIEYHNDQLLGFENRINYRNSIVSNLMGFHAYSFKATDSYDFDLLFPISATAATPVAVEQSIIRTQQALAIFDSMTIRATNEIAITAGLRGEHVSSKYETDVSGSRLKDIGNSGNNTIDTYISQISGNYSGTNAKPVLLPKFGVSYTQDGHFSSLSYARGYRTSGVSINRRRAVAVEYDPEYTNNYELAYKYTAPGIQLAFNGFYIDWREQQVQVQLSNDFYDTQVDNAAMSQVIGGELESDFRISSLQQLSLGVGYSDTRFKDFKTRNGDYTGNRFPYASRWTGRIAHELKPIERLSILTVLRMLDKSYTNAENTREADPQFYLNLGAKYAFGDWLIEAYVNNVTNRKFHIFDGTPTSTSSPYQASYHQTSTPRQMGARVSYVW